YQGGLAEMYWAFAKNQVFERAIDVGESTDPNSFIGACLIHPNLIGPPLLAGEKPGLPWDWAPGPIIQPFEGTLESLSSVAVRIEPIDGFLARVTVGAVNGGKDPDLVSKVYDESDLNCSDADVPDGERILDGARAMNQGYGGPNGDYFYVLVSNLSFTDKKS